MPGSAIHQSPLRALSPSWRPRDVGGCGPGPTTSERSWIAMGRVGVRPCTARIARSSGGDGGRRATRRTPQARRRGQDPIQARLPTPRVLPRCDYAQWQAPRQEDRQASRSDRSSNRAGRRPQPRPDGGSVLQRRARSRLGWWRERFCRGCRRPADHDAVWLRSSLPNATRWLRPRPTWDRDRSGSCLESSHTDPGAFGRSLVAHVPSGMKTRWILSVEHCTNCPVGLRSDPLARTNNSKERMR
jgi:hypothetical protein